MSDNDLFGRPSTSDDGQRSEHDRYYTPSWMTEALRRYHPIDPTATILEPCAGDGAIARVFEAAGHHVLTNDLDRRQPAQLGYDATAAALWQVVARSPGVSVVVTNPPFNHALQILQRAIAAVPLVAMLLRKTFLEPTEERGEFLRQHPPTRILGLQRHSFRGQGNDSVSCDWMIWEAFPNRSLPPIVVVPDARPVKVRRRRA